MRTYFKIRYLFDREEVHRVIERRLAEPGADYVCVADGVIMNTANRREQYLKVINGGLFAICDSGFVPLYINLIHGEKHGQYTGSQILMDIVAGRKHRMLFMGAQQPVLDGLKRNLMDLNPDVEGMKFVELPFRRVEEFDYPAIARMIEEDGADIIWVALGAPKQEYFMNYLKPHLSHGVMIAVGAAFKFYSGLDVGRAPQWMIDRHLEFIHRLLKEPRKQGARCFDIVRTLPGLLWQEWRRKQRGE